MDPLSEIQQQQQQQQQQQNQQQQQPNQLADFSIDRMFEKMNNNNNDNSWVQFDDQQTSDQQQSSLPTTINSLKTIDSKSVVVNDDGDGDDNINKSAIRLKSSNSSAENNQQSQQQQQQQFATIDLSANSTTQVLQINGGNSGGNGGGGGNSTNIAGSSSSSNLTKSNHSNTSSSVLNIPKSGFSNGDIVVTLYPLNNNCAWLTPATFKAHLVPEELMAQPLTLTVEDYVSTMSILLSDYRFHLYITLHKRILALWITLSIIVLLGILASGTKGLSIFLSGIMWLVLNALGIFLVIFIKSRLYRMLEECLSQINSIFGRHNIFLGIDDRGHFSCHKINLIFVYFDPKYCIKFLQDMLKNNNNKDLQTTKHQHQNNRNQHQNIDTSILDGNSGDNRFIGDDDNIYITGSSGTRQISQKEKQAEKLLYRYSQRWIREFGRQRMSLSIIQPQPEQSSSSSSSLQPQQQQQQSNNSNQQQQQQQQSINITIPSSTDIPPRHCRQAKCFCQFIEEMYRGKQQQQQQQQQQSFGNFCLTSFLPCISMIPSFCR
ncbi:hypothetical protein DERF_008407 [Dermatophagoides farinae]|uniref:Uncharacterized protein n=1 Tax=Dermatophagoides farinae TaxID=6954 RepID=A0A922I1J4_DERFA|nr:hypothetical protein DERF_008407 [Dermatophagoides farinae]